MVRVRVRQNDPRDLAPTGSANDRSNMAGVIGAWVDDRHALGADQIGVGSWARHQPGIRRGQSAHSAAEIDDSPARKAPFDEA
jgi:hypothetical protein